MQNLFASEPYDYKKTDRCEVAERDARCRDEKGLRRRFAYEAVVGVRRAASKCMEGAHLCLSVLRVPLRMRSVVAPARESSLRRHRLDFALPRCRRRREEYRTVEAEAVVRDRESGRSDGRRMTNQSPSPIRSRRTTRRKPSVCGRCSRLSSRPVSARACQPDEGQRTLALLPSHHLVVDRALLPLHRLSSDRTASQHQPAGISTFAFVRWSRFRLSFTATPATVLARWSSCDGLSRRCRVRWRSLPSARQNPFSKVCPSRNVNP